MEMVGGELIFLKLMSWQEVEHNASKEIVTSGHGFHQVVKLNIS